MPFKKGTRHPAVEKHLKGIHPDDMTHAEKQMWEGRHPHTALHRMAKEDMSHAEKHIAHESGMKGHEKNPGADMSTEHERRRRKADSYGMGIGPGHSPSGQDSHLLHGFGKPGGHAGFGR